MGELPEQQHNFATTEENWYIGTICHFMYMARCKVISDSAPNYGLIILENSPTDGSDKNLNGLFRIFSVRLKKNILLFLKQEI